MINGNSFLISNSALDNMMSIQMLNDKVLNWHRDLRVEYSEDRRYILIGECWSSRNGENPNSIIANSKGKTTNEILDAEKYWCGRYVLILENCIYMDTCGLMNVFYDNSYISNSLNLIRELNGLDIKQETLFYGVSPDFVIGTETQYNNIKRLLPSGILDYISGEVKPRTLLPDIDDDFRSKEDRIKCFINEYSTGLKNLQNHFPDYKIAIACTAGRDSRVSLSIAEYIGASYDVFLLNHDNISTADVLISHEISNKLNKEWYFVRRKKSDYSEARLEAFDVHTCNYVIDQDRWFYTYGQYEELKKKIGKNIVVLRSGLWECLNEYYGIKDFEDIDDVFKIVRYNPRYNTSLRKWVEFASNDNNNDSISKGNRFYIDMRAGCWLSSIEQSFDLYDGIVSVQPLNCRRYLSLLLGFSEEERTNKYYEELIAKHACSLLSSIPYDYVFEKSAIDRINRLNMKIKKAIWIVKTYGISAMVDYCIKQ